MESSSKQVLILIIDDDLISCNMLARVLKYKGYATHAVANGYDGLQYLKENQVDLVLLDSEMPIISGEQVLQKIREQPQFQFLPVLMVTSTEKNDHILKMFELGINDYLTKPVNVPVLIARIKRFLNVVDKIHADRIENELKMIRALIGTYNHEINNPLASAMGFLELEMEHRTEPSRNLIKIKSGLERISAIVKKLHDLTDTKINLEKYTENSQILKIAE